jgi:hypothetical protein
MMQAVVLQQPILLWCESVLLPDLCVTTLVLLLPPAFLWHQVCAARTRALLRPVVQNKWKAV